MVGIITLVVEAIPKLWQISEYIGEAHGKWYDTPVSKVRNKHIRAHSYYLYGHLKTLRYFSMNETEKEILERRGRPELKEVEYDDFIGRKGKVVYEVRKNKVIFSALVSSRDATSTVQAAERVVIAICEAEGINWRDPEFADMYEFFDLSTPLGYPGRTESPIRRLMDMPDIEIDKLHISPREDYIHVDYWTPVDQSVAKETFLNKT